MSPPSIGYLNEMHIHLVYRMMSLKFFQELDDCSGACPNCSYVGMVMVQSSIFVFIATLIEYNVPCAPGVPELPDRYGCATRELVPPPERDAEHLLARAQRVSGGILSGRHALVVARRVRATAGGGLQLLGQ